MHTSKKTIVLPVLLITVGIGWLVTSLGVMPTISWVWTLFLAAVGVLTLYVAGIDKVTLVAGPFFVLSALLSILRQTGRIDIEIELPVLIISLGVLMLVARHPVIPSPQWLPPAPRPNKRKRPSKPASA